MGVIGKKQASGGQFCQVVACVGEVFIVVWALSHQFSCASLLFKMNVSEDCDANSSTVAVNLKCEVHSIAWYLLHEGHSVAEIHCRLVFAYSVDMYWVDRMWQSELVSSKMGEQVSMMKSDQDGQLFLLTTVLLKWKSIFIYLLH